MSKIVWDKTGERYLESGVSHGVLYVGKASAANLEYLRHPSALKNDSADWPLTYTGTAQMMGTETPTHPTAWYQIGLQFPDSVRLSDGLDGVQMFVTEEIAYSEPEGEVGYKTGQYLEFDAGGEPGYSKIISSVDLAGAEFDPTLQSYEYTEGYGYWTQDKKLVSYVAMMFGGLIGSSGSKTIPDVVSFDLENNRIYLYHVKSEKAEDATVTLPNGSTTTITGANLNYSQYGFGRNSVRVTRDYHENTGVGWNGLISISASPEGAEDNDQWADNMKYSRTKSKETWGGTIEAYQSPKEFDACDGSAEAVDGVNVGQQRRESFGLCYRTEIMNDASGGESCGYLLHLLYNLTASPSERSYETINDSPDAMTLSWELDGVPVNVDGYEPLTEITIDSRYADAEKLAELEGMLFGTDESDAYQPSAKDVIDLFVTT